MRYSALQSSPHTNYYEGRADADLTASLEYSVAGMAGVFQRVAGEVREQVGQPGAPEPEALRRLDRRARIVLGLFSRQESVTTAEMARALGLSPRTVRDLVGGWLPNGWLVVEDPARKSRRYHLSAEYRRFIGEITAG